MKQLLPALVAISLSAASPLCQAADAPKPLKVLLITGGCCHDYAKQKNILKDGIEKRANIVVDLMHTDEKSTHPQLELYTKADWAAGYDVIIHDECAADIKDPAVVESVLKPHLDGVPAVNLHCAMHCYRIGDPKEAVTDTKAPHAFWFNYLGLQSSGHGAQKPIEISFEASGSPITKGMSNWTTIKEELYNNVKVWDDTKVLARGKQDAGDQPGKNNSVLIWTHEYGPKKTRVFSTTLGHNNETVADDRYLELVVRGVLWSAGKLGEDGQPLDGFGK